MINPEKELDILMAASAGCILDFKQIAADYAVADPELSPEAQKTLAHKCELAEGLAAMLLRLVKDEKYK